MKNETTSLDLYYLVQGWQELIGARVDKIFQQKEQKKNITLRLHVQGLGKQLLRFSLPKYMYITRYKELFPEQPPGYCTFLRKYLTKARLRKIEQKDFERIILATFERGDDTYILIAELFSKGNVILCDKTMRIMSPLENQNWEGRTIRGNTQYTFPPSQANTPQLSEKEFSELVNSSQRENIVKFLAIECGLGGMYAEEVCHLAKVDKKTKKPTAKQIKDIHKALMSLFRKKIKACLYDKNIITPFPLSTLENPKPADTFNVLIDDIVSDQLVLEQEKQVDSKMKEKEDRIQIILNMQQQKIIGFEKSALENQKKGELLYENYQAISSILKEIQEMRKTKSWTEIKNLIKKRKEVVSIDENKGTITINV